MRVFLTGGTGFVGSHLVQELHEAGHTIRALVRPSSDVGLLEDVGAETVVGSLEDEALLRDALAGCDAVVHLAGKQRLSSEAELLALNATATGRLARVAAEAVPELRRFVFVSSVLAAGPSPDQDPIDEEQSPHPLSIYARSKRRGEERLLEVAGEIPITILRAPLVYGPRDRRNLRLFRAARRGIVPLASTGAGRLSVLYVGDLCRAVVLVLGQPHASPAVFHVADDRELTWRQLGEAVGGALGVRARPVNLPAWLVSLASRVGATYGRVRQKPVVLSPDRLPELKAHNWTCSPQAIQETLGWEAETALEDGMALTANWYRKAGWL